MPTVSGHKGPVLDISWCPHNDNVIASASEDCSVKVWQIPEGGLTRPMTDSVVDLLQHQRRVMIVLWHPSAQNILMSAGSDNNIIIWNVATAEALNVITLPDLVYSGSWNWDGSEVLFTCKDRKLRRIDPRSGEILEEAVAHEGNKPSRAIFLKNGLIFTTGFTKHSERQYSLRAPGHLTDPMVMVDLDTSNGVMFPIYDPDVNLLYLCGKGDSVIRYFEITPEPPFVHYISTFQSTDPQRGIGYMPKRGCDVTICEMTRFFRLNNNGLCQVIPFVVPRKSELFQEDLYPDTVSDVPAITGEEWWEGKNADPVLISMSDIADQVKKQEDLVVQKKTSVIEKGKTPQILASTALSTKSATSEVDIDKLTLNVLEKVRKHLSDLAESHKEEIQKITEEVHRMKKNNVEQSIELQKLKVTNQEQYSDIMKLRAMIAKHDSQLKELQSSIEGEDHVVLLNSNGEGHNEQDEMDPDEV